MTVGLLHFLNMVYILGKYIVKESALYEQKVLLFLIILYVVLYIIVIIYLIANPDYYVNCIANACLMFQLYLSCKMFENYM